MTIGRVALGASAALLLMILLVTAAAAAVIESLAAPWDALDTGSSPRSNQVPDADGDVPVQMYELYRQAAATCPRLSWTILAGIGKAASDHGRRIDGHGVMGLAQQLFDQYSQPAPAGGARPASLADPVDTVYAAARALCRPESAADIKAVVRTVAADSATAVRIVELADLYAHAPHAGSFIATAARSAPTPAARLAVEYAGAQLGLPYIWGGDGPDRSSVPGFDCSGLTQTAYQAGGIAIPRTATEQFHTGHPVEVKDLRAGDLVFYGNPVGFLHHVGIYLMRGLIIDAPHTGAFVRLDPVAASDYAGARREP